MYARTDRFHYALAAAVCVGVVQGATRQASEILNAAGVKGGLVVHLGCGDGELTAVLCANDSYLVHGLDRDAEDVRVARAHIRSRGLYGEVSVDRLIGERLPYADNLVNLLVVSKGENQVGREEMLRVLAPGGVALVGGARGKKVLKVWPKEIDEWTHHLHGPDGNPVANDLAVGPPKHYQWLAGPLWFRSHDTDSIISALVTAKGRIFYIVDEAPTSLTGDHGLPDKWALVARDAFNGVLLWKVPIRRWGWREWKHTWLARRPENLPVNLPRRLVAVGDKVYVTLGYHAPVSQLDAATGKVIQTYQGTDDTREILCHGDTLVLSVFKAGQFRLMAINAQSGKTLWETEPELRGSSREYFDKWTKVDEREPTKVDPALNPATDGKVVCLIDGQEIVCLDFETGRQRWRTKVTEAEPALWVGTLVLHDRAVLYAKPDELMGLAVETGEKLWSQPVKKLGWLWFEWKDVFVIRGLVWAWGTELAQTVVTRGKRKQRSRWPVHLNAFDPLTGELKKQVPLGNIFKAGHHHRCYRNKATPRYLLASRRGTEFVDLEKGQHTVHNWVRGTCHLGMMPANGLQYAPTHPCMCYIDEKLNGFNALAAGRSGERAPRRETDRLERGPAFPTIGNRKSTAANPQDWPTFRRDGLRNGAANTSVPSQLASLWSTKVGRRLSPPTIVEDRVFVSLIDEHQVVALNANDGKTLWEFVAGARVDTPPTCHQGLVIFGSADGWAYCLRAADGALVWRFQAAPEDRRIGAFGQLESAWPVHGSILVQNGLAYFSAGRSSHLDGGIWLYAVEPATGKLVHKAHLEGPHLNVGNMADNFAPPQGALSDILQGDGTYVYLRNLKFDSKLTKQDDAGGGRLRTRSGFLDDTYFKRASWSLGRGNWGRLMVNDGELVYYVKMFEVLRYLTRANYFTPGKDGYLLGAKGSRRLSQIKVANTQSLTPTNKPITAEAWVRAAKPDGAVLARGGAANGYALVLKAGKPRFVIRRSTEKTDFVEADQSVVGRWVHLAGVLTDEKELRIYVDGKLCASAPASGFVGSPGQPMEIGADAQSGVGEYESPFAFTGLIDEVRVHFRALTDAEISQRCENPGSAAKSGSKLALCYSFDHGDARDESGSGNDGQLEGVEPVEGKSGKAVRFVGSGDPGWSQRIPVRARAMVVANKLLFLAGPPDIVDAEDPLAAFEGRKGGLLHVYSAKSGEKLAECKLGSPPVFNGMAAAREKLFIATRDGHMVCLGEKR